MSLEKTTSAQQKCSHFLQTGAGSNHSNIRRTCSRCGFNVLHVATSYVKGESWRKLEELMSLRTTERAAASDVDDEDAKIKKEATVDPVDPLDPADEIKHPELVNALLQRIDEQDQLLRQKNGQLNKLEVENRVLRTKTRHLKVDLEYLESVVDWAEVEPIESEPSSQAPIEPEEAASQR